MKPRKNMLKKQLLAGSTRGELRSEAMISLVEVRCYNFSSELVGRSTLRDRKIQKTVGGVDWQKLQNQHS